MIFTSLILVLLGAFTPAATFSYGALVVIVCAHVGGLSGLLFLSFVETESNMPDWIPGHSPPDTLANIIWAIFGSALLSLLGTVTVLAVKSLLWFLVLSVLLAVLLTPLFYF